MVQPGDNGCFKQADSSRPRKRTVGLDIRSEEEEYAKVAYGINYR